MYPSEIYKLLGSLIKEARLPGTPPAQPQGTQPTPPGNAPGGTAPGGPGQQPASGTSGETPVTRPEDLPANPRLVSRTNIIDVDDFHPWENPYASGPNRENRARSIAEYLNSHPKDNLVAKPNPFAFTDFNGRRNEFYDNLLTGYENMYNSAYNAGMYSGRSNPYAVRPRDFRRFVPYKKNNLFIKQSSFNNLLFKNLMMF